MQRPARMDHRKDGTWLRGAVMLLPFKTSTANGPRQRSATRQPVRLSGLGAAWGKPREAGETGVRVRHVGRGIGSQLNRLQHGETRAFQSPRPIHVVVS